jgi:serine protease
MTLSRVRLAAVIALACSLLLLVTLAWPSGGRPAGTYAADQAPAVAGQLVVQFRGDASSEQRAALLAASGATLDRQLSLPGYVTVTVPPGREAEVGLALAASPAVATVEKDIIRYPAALPNDPYYPQQWNMPMIGLDAARELANGSGVTVAVVDTGVAFENYHDPAKDVDFALAPDLAGVTFVDPCDATGSTPCWCAPASTDCQCESGSPPCVNPARDVHANDDFGHGTHIAGTIAQATNNGLGTAGIAPGAKIMPVKVCRLTLGKYGCPVSDLADGINYAVQDGADVINLSITGLPTDGLSSAERDALAAAEAAGVAVVAASGNEGTNVLDYPAAVASVIAVGAVGMNATRPLYSNYGQGEGNKTLDLVAPGGDPDTEGPASVILQQSYSVCTGATNYTAFPDATPCKGTSMAAAHVSGVAALIKSKFPAISLDDLRALLKCSALDLGDPGQDLRYGAGLVQAGNALLDVDHDNIPDCLDAQVSTPTPTFTPPPDDCKDVPTPAATLTPTPTATPSPTPTPANSPMPSFSGEASPTASETGTPTPMPTPTPTVIMPSHTDAPPPVPKCGDVDCSGAVNAVDALGVVSWYANSLPVASCIGLGYVTCDDDLNAADAVRILAYSGGLMTQVACSPPG